MSATIAFLASLPFHPVLAQAAAADAGGGGVFAGRGWIVTLIIGLIIGAIAKLLMPGKDPGGCIITILIGLVGSFIGSLIGGLFSSGGYAAGWIMSIVGAMLLLFLYRMITGRRGGGPPAV